MEYCITYVSKETKQEVNFFVSHISSAGLGIITSSLRAAGNSNVDHYRVEDQPYENWHRDLSRL